MSHHEFRRRVQSMLEQDSEKYQSLYEQIFGSQTENQSSTAQNDQSSSSSSSSSEDGEKEDGEKLGEKLPQNLEQQHKTDHGNESATTTITTNSGSSSSSHGNHGGSVDQDLLNNINRLENELAQQKKHYEKEMHNLEQQIEVWKERNKKRLELERELDLKNEQITELNTQLSDQQQLVKQLLDEREKSNRDNQEIIARMSSLQEERANLVTNNDALNKRLTNLQTQVTTANQMRDKMRKDNVDLSRRIGELEKGEENLKNLLEQYKRYKSDLDSMTENFGTLQQNHKSSLAQLAQAQNENVRLKDTCRELDIVKQKLEQAERKLVRLTQTNTEQTKLVKQWMQSSQLYHHQLEETSKTLIHHFVESTLASWSTKVLMNDYESLKNEAAKVPELISRLEVAESEANKWQLKVKDTKTEYLLELKKNKNLVKELRSQLQSQMNNSNNNNNSNNQDHLQSSRSVGSPRREHAPSSSFDSPRALLRSSQSAAVAHHGRSDSIGSPTSVTSSSSTWDHTATALHANQSALEQLQKDNNILLTKIGELQQTKWNLSERVRHLEESAMLLQEELEKKQTIIQHYVERERTGRIAPEQERFAQNMRRKQEQKTGTVSGTTTINPDAYKHMQQVMQETLLHNIQLQRDIRTLGTEIARLQEKVRAAESANQPK